MPFYLHLIQGVHRFCNKLCLSSFVECTRCFVAYVYPATYPIWFITICHHHRDSFISLTFKLNSFAALYPQQACAVARGPYEPSVLVYSSSRHCRSSWVAEGKAALQHNIMICIVWYTVLVQSVLSICMALHFCGWGFLHSQSGLGDASLSFPNRCGAPPAVLQCCTAKSVYQVWYAKVDFKTCQPKVWGRGWVVKHIYRHSLLAPNTWFRNALLRLPVTRDTCWLQASMYKRCI